MLFRSVACLIFFVFITSRHRKRRSDSYHKHINDLSSFSCLEDDDVDRSTYIVGDCDSIDWFREEDIIKRGNNVSSLGYQHDVHKCTSAYCNACQNQRIVYPKFVISSDMPDNLADLRCGPSIVEDCRSYSSPDTVNL